MDVHQNARTTVHSRAGLVKRVNAGEPSANGRDGLGSVREDRAQWVWLLSRK
jgi:hypothetical protein